MTIEQLEEMRKVDVQCVDRNSLVDLQEIRIDQSLPKEQKIKDFVTKIKNPYCFMVGNVVVKVAFNPEGLSFEEQFEKMLLGFIRIFIKSEWNLWWKCAIIVAGLNWCRPPKILLGNLANKKFRRFAYMKENKIYKAAIYVRLSKEDGDVSDVSKAESNSISNQKELIREFLKNKEDIVVVSERVDDGYSGVNFERPAFQLMLEDIKQGKVDCVVVKDLSRFGRNYIESGRYIEKIFPMLGVRFIAINDNYDSLIGKSQTDEIVIPFKNLINDAYCRDISIKIKSHLDVKRRKGEFIGSFTVYGYKKDERNHNLIIVDEYAARIVSNIFSWKIAGMSQQGIADRLNDMGVLSPAEYKKSCGSNYRAKFQTKSKASWSAVAVTRILTNENYTGTLIQGKYTTPNYKVKKTVVKNEEDWVRIENAF